MTLQGACIVVTGAADKSDGLTSALEAAGARVVSMPLIVTKSLAHEPATQAALAHAAEAAVIAVTSAAAVAPFAEALAATGRSLAGLPGAFVAVGPATEAALAAAGVRVAVVAEDHRGEGVADAILLRSLAKPGQRVLLPRARVAREVLPERLREAGLVVDVVPIYETSATSEEVTAAGLAALRGGAAKGITFASASAVERFVERVGDDAAALLGRVVVACIGPVTSEALARRGLPVHVTAQPHTAPALATALSAYFASSPHRLR